MGRGPCGRGPGFFAGRGPDVVHTDMGWGWPWPNMYGSCFCRLVAFECCDLFLAMYFLTDVTFYQKLNENHTLIRKYPDVFLSTIGLSHAFVDTNVHPTLRGHDKICRCWVTYVSVFVVLRFLFFIYAFRVDMGSLDFVKSVDLFKIIRLVNHTIVDELKETSGKKKRKVALTAGLPLVKKARPGGIIILDPSPTTAGKNPTAMKNLITQKGQHDVGLGSAARPTEDFVSSFVTLTSEHTEAEAIAASFVNEIKTSSIPKNEARVSSLLWSDAKFLDRLNVNSTQHVCMMSELRLCYEHEITIKEKFEKKFVKSFETIQQKDAEVATLKSKLERMEGLNDVELLGKVSELESTRNELKGKVSKLEADCDAKDQRFMKRSAKLDARIAEINYDMDTELYPHMMTAVVGPISMAINKEIHAVLEVEHGKAGRSLSKLEAYDAGLEALKDYPLELLMSSLTLEGNHGDEDPTLEFWPDSISHEILLSDALAASYNHTEKRKADASSSLSVSRPSVIMPYVSSQETSLVVVDYQISSVAIVDNTVPSVEPHDDLFDTTVLDKPVDP
uniref:Transposase (Putative), gypsy type n=1 Tax=Tanacetum cinerariifolium TaxID=118510 RepID=A0A6L2KMA2_TANCI|nr:hypothetical protein [Tanacetum cinerariifolium]